MKFLTPAGVAFDVPEGLILAALTPCARLAWTAYVHAPGGPLEIRIVPIADVEPPERLGDIEHFNPGRTARILLGMAAGDPLPPVRVCAFPGERYPYRVRDGFHRFRLFHHAGG